MNVGEKAESDGDEPEAAHDTEFPEAVAVAMRTLDPSERDESKLEETLDQRLDNQEIIKELSASHPLTAVVKLPNIAKHYDLTCELWAKCEFQHLSGSSQYRVALVMLEILEKRGIIKPSETTLITHTSASFAFALAMANIRQRKKYDLVAVLPDRASKSKVNLLSLMDVKIFRAPEEASDNRESRDSPAIIAEELKGKIRNSVILDPFSDALSTDTHLWWTAPELLGQMEKIDVLVCGFETGGLISGLVPFLKHKNEQMVVVGADLSGKVAGGEKEKICNSDGLIEEYSSPKVSTILNPTLADKWYTIPTKDAFCKAREILLLEGIPASPSAGAVVSAAVQAIKDLNLSGDSQKKIVLILDHSALYTDFEFASNDWMVRHGFYTHEDIESFIWFHKMFAWRIPVSVPVTVLSTFSAFAVYSMMAGEDVQRIVVYDANTRSILGIATAHSLRAGIERGLITCATLIGTSQCICTSFQTIFINESISTLMEVFKTHSFAVLVQKQIIASKLRPQREQVWVAGVLDVGEVVSFLADLEKKHAKKFGAVLSGGFQSAKICRDNLNLEKKEDPNETKDVMEKSQDLEELAKDIMGKSQDLQELAKAIAPNLAVSIVCNASVPNEGLGRRPEPNHHPGNLMGEQGNVPLVPPGGHLTGGNPPQTLTSGMEPGEGTGLMEITLEERFSMPFTPASSQSFNPTSTRAPPPSQITITAAEDLLMHPVSSQSLMSDSVILLNSAESSSTLQVEMSSELVSSSTSDGDLQNDMSALSISESVFRALYTTAHTERQRRLGIEANSNLFDLDVGEDASHSSSSNFLQSPSSMYVVPIFFNDRSQIHENETVTTVVAPIDGFRETSDNTFGGAALPQSSNRSQPAPSTSVKISPAVPNDMTTSEEVKNPGNTSDKPDGPVKGNVTSQQKAGPGEGIPPPETQKNKLNPK